MRWELTLRRPILIQWLAKTLSKSCFDLFDSQIAYPRVWRPENLHIVILRRPNIRIRRTEQQNAICSSRRGEMRNSAVVSNKYRALKQSSQLRQRQILLRNGTFRFSPLAFQLLRLCVRRPRRKSLPAKNILQI